MYQSSDSVTGLGRVDFSDKYSSLEPVFANSYLKKAVTQHKLMEIKANNFLKW
jgi:hypothetical protein